MKADSIIHPMEVNRLVIKVSGMKMDTTLTKKAMIRMVYLIITKVDIMMITLNMFQDLTGIVLINVIRMN
jgi:hypothetical protein